jgi:hypothetical protein
LPDVDAYLGSPDPRGEARTSYVFSFIEPVDSSAPPPAVPDVPERKANILAIALVIALGVLLLLAALVVWSLS